jgi:hypothetical protein
MVSGKIDLAAGKQKAAVDQVDHSMGQVARKERTVVGAAVFAQPAGHKYFGVAVGQGQLYVRVSLVISQQDVETGLALLDEVVFERQGLMLVLHQDVVYVHGFAHERAGLGVCLGSVQNVRAYPGAQVICFADVDHLAVGIFVQIHPGPGWQVAYLFVQIHGESP